MARYAYERLSAQDATFLWAEGENAPMHVGAVASSRRGRCATPTAGSTSRATVRDRGVLHWIPRYRQKLAWIPLEGWPAWVDDRHFDLGYHIRHLALRAPAPSTSWELASRILSRRLDRPRPLWEIWVIEGLEGGEQFALLNKIHHCMIDGAAGAEFRRSCSRPRRGGERSAARLHTAARRRPPASCSPTRCAKHAPPARCAAGAAARACRRACAARSSDALRRARSLGDRSALRARVRFADQRRAQPASPARLAHDAPRRLLELRGVLECTVNDSCSRPSRARCAATSSAAASTPRSSISASRRRSPPAPSARAAPRQPRLDLDPAGRSPRRTPSRSSRSCASARPSSSARMRRSAPTR